MSSIISEIVDGMSVAKKIAKLFSQIKSKTMSSAIIIKNNDVDEIEHMKILFISEFSDQLRSVLCSPEIKIGVVDILLREFDKMEISSGEAES